MLDIQFIRQHQPQVEQACRHKGLNPEVVGRLLSLDRQRRDLIEKIQLVRTKRNILNRELKKARTSALLKKATDLKQELQSLEPELKQV